MDTLSYVSGSNFLLFMRNVVGSEITVDYGKIGFIHILKTCLENREAPVLFMEVEYGHYAVNGIRFVQDASNPNYYYIGVYDNNYPSEIRYIDLECKNDICMTRANDYYSIPNGPVRITLSLEDDLKFYSE